MAYTPKNDHRNGSPLKSQWSISIALEEQCYVTATVMNWNCGGSYWGLHFPNSTPEIIGTSPTMDSLYIAKFVGDQGNWHGYPVAHWLSPFDKPNEMILEQWSQAGLINSTKKSKIHRGKKCAL